MSFKDAKEFLSHYPKTRAAIDMEGLSFAAEMMRNISDPDVRVRLCRGELTPEEDVEPQSPMSLAELEASGRKLPNDFYKLRAAAYIYASGSKN